MSSQTPGTQQNRDDHKSRPQQGGQHGQQDPEDKKQGPGKDQSRGNSTNPASDADRSRKPGQKPQP